jgi:hypothetical protein
MPELTGADRLREHVSGRDRAVQWTGSLSRNIASPYPMTRSSQNIVAAMAAAMGKVSTHDRRIPPITLLSAVPLTISRRQTRASSIPACRDGSQK